MSIVLANWKAAFLREKGILSLIIWTLVLMAMCLLDYGFGQWRGSSRDLEDVGWFVGGVGFLLLIGPGFGVLRLQRGVMAQPLFFCLPGYRESLRGLTFSAAIACGVAWSAVREPLGRPATSAEIGLDLAGGFLAANVFYLALTTPQLILSRRAFALLRLAAIPLFLVALTVLSEARNVPLVIWPVFMPVLVAACAFVWIRLGDMECVKRGQRTIFEEAIKRGPAPGPPRTTLPWLEKWLQSQMERQSYLHWGRYVWGELYATIGRLLHYWKWVLGLLLGCAWLLGDMGQFAATVVFAASGSLAWIQRWPLMSPLLLPGGRKDRCRATIGTVVALSLLLLAAASGVVVLSWLLTLFLGRTPVEGQEPSYAGLHVYGVFWTCLLVPWFSALGLLGSRMPSLGELCTIIFVVVLVPFFCVLAIPIWPAWVLRVVVAGVFVGGWLFFLLVLWVVSIRWDLVGQRPTRED